jgi:hypothetical protein
MERRPAPKTFVGGQPAVDLNDFQGLIGLQPRKYLRERL